MNNVNLRASKYRTNTVTVSENCKEMEAIIHLVQNKNKQSFVNLSVKWQVYMI